MRHNQVNVLFTSIGRRVELVRAFQKAYSVFGAEGKIIGLDVDPLAPALQAVDVPYIVPNVGSEDYIPTLETICRNEEVNLVFPLIDPDIPVLARARRGSLPKAVIVVHLYGQSADLAPIWTTCQQYGVPLIEDACEALGATYLGGRPERSAHSVSIRSTATK
jgi:DegT/DnrJ/EryC1/StrS aminotransferase family